MNTSLFTWLTWLSPASGQMSDYMDAQCNGIQHADRLASLQKVTEVSCWWKHHDGLSTSVLWLWQNHIHEHIKEEKKKLLILNDTEIFQHASLTVYSVAGLKGREKRDSTHRWQWQNEKLRLSHSTGNHDSSCTRVYALESVYKLRLFSRMWAKSARETWLPSFSPVLLLLLFSLPAFSLFDFKGAASVFLSLADFVVTEGWPPREVSDNDVFLEVLSSSSDTSDCIFLSSSERRSTSFKVSPLIPLKYSMECLHTSLSWLFLTLTVVVVVVVVVVLVEVWFLNDYCSHLGVEWYFLVVLIFIFLKLDDMTIFLHVCASSLDKCLFKALLIFKLSCLFVVEMLRVFIDSGY